MGRTLTDNEAMRTYSAVRFVEGQPGYQLPPRENKRLPEGDGGGGGDFAIVTPTGEVCDGIGFTCDCAIAEVFTASCGSGLAPGDLINVWDLCRLWFNMPNELLTSTNFYCQKVKVHEDEYNRPPGLTGDCRWVVTGMCCREVEYYGY